MLRHALLLLADHSWLIVARDGVGLQSRLLTACSQSQFLNASSATPAGDAPQQQQQDERSGVKAGEQHHCVHHHLPAPAAAPQQQQQQYNCQWSPVIPAQHQNTCLCSRQPDHKQALHSCQHQHTSLQRHTQQAQQREQLQQQLLPSWHHLGSRDRHALLSCQHQQQQQHHYHLHHPAAVQVRWAHAGRSNQQHSSSKRGGAAAAPAAAAAAAATDPASKPQQRRNHQIRAPRLLVVFPDGTKAVLPTAEARAAAEGLQLDLVEVNPRTDPPVARILDYGKMMYEQQQKTEAADKMRRLQQKLATPKEMQFSARIADHDLEVKMRKVTGWLEQGYRVQLLVKHGRAEEEAAADALTYLSTRLQSEFKVEVGPQQAQRRALSVLIKPLAPQQQQQQQQ